jgi:hypothetical protein
VPAAATEAAVEEREQVLDEGNERAQKHAIEEDGAQAGSALFVV